MGIVAGGSERHAHELCIRRDLVNCAHDGVVTGGVLLGGHFVLELHFVEHFPDGEFVVVAGIMAYTVFVAETAIDIPADETRVVVTEFLAGGVCLLYTSPSPR